MANQRLIVGLTGNIGTGKSTVLNYLRSKGAYTVDADQLTHRALAVDGPAYADVVRLFGRSILNDDGSIHRPSLGKLVFADAQKLAQLEQIVHPAVFQLAQQEIGKTDATVIILEAIKLLESNNLIRLCDEIWVVTSSPETQLLRLMQQRGMDEAEAKRRMAAQSPQAEKIKRANRMIDNDASPEKLYRQLDRIWEEITDKMTG